MINCMGNTKKSLILTLVENSKNLKIWKDLTVLVLQGTLLIQMTQQRLVGL